MRHNPTHTRGFTLVEMLVSVAIFSIVMVIALGALLALSESDRKAQSLSSAVNNLSFAIDSMSRSIRVGTAYHCGIGGDLSAPQDCKTMASDSFTFQNPSGGEVIYRFSNIGCGTGGTGCLERSLDLGATFIPLTSPEVVLTSVEFYVIGSTPGDQWQPKVTMLISGYVPLSSNKQSNFTLQTSVTQRIYDKS